MISFIFLFFWIGPIFSSADSTSDAYAEDNEEVSSQVTN